MNDPIPDYLQGNVDAWQQKAADYAAALESIRKAGYDMSQLETVPQEW